jgi:hypothetical protein
MLNQRINFNEIFIDNTPNEDYPIRVLKEFRVWSLGHKIASNSIDNQIIIKETELQNKRLELLDHAIETLIKAKTKDRFNN